MITNLKIMIKITNNHSVLDI